MNVGELKKMLGKYPNDMDVLIPEFSDYQLLNENGCSVVKGVPQNNHEWIMRSHPTMSEENKMGEKAYLLLDIYYS